jgi:hypothetical protein
LAIKFSITVLPGFPGVADAPITATLRGLKKLSSEGIRDTIDLLLVDARAA